MGMQWGYYYLAKVQQIAMIFGCVGERVIPEHCQFHYDRCWSSNSWDNPFILLGNDGRLAGSTSWGITNLAAESELRHRENHGKTHHVPPGWSVSFFRWADVSMTTVCHSWYVPSKNGWDVPIIDFLQSVFIGLEDNKIHMFPVSSPQSNPYFGKECPPVIPAGRFTHLWMVMINGY